MKNREDYSKQWIVFSIILLHLLWNGCHAVQSGSKWKQNESKESDSESLSSHDISNLLRNIIDGKDKGGKTKADHDSCASQFKVQDNSIIRTRDSIKNGAKFLKAPDVDTVEDCIAQCCGTKDLTRPCELATFQKHSDDMDNDDDKQPRCFLFSCTDKSGKSVCVTASNSDYKVLKRIQQTEVNELLDVVQSSAKATTVSTTTTTDTTTTTTKATTTESTTTMTTTSQAPSTSSSVLVTTTTKAVEPTLISKNVCSKTCHRLEWKCDDGCCVKVTDVCNSKPDCQDQSDERDCESIMFSSSEEKHSQTSQIQKPKNSATESNQQQNSATVKASTSHPLKAENSATLDHVTDVSNLEEDFASEKMEGEQGALLPLAIGLAVTLCILLMVICRLRIMKKKLKRRGKPLTMEESDYLINGMYL